LVGGNKFKNGIGVIKGQNLKNDSTLYPLSRTFSLCFTATRNIIHQLAGMNELLELIQFTVEVVMFVRINLTTHQLINFL
jgi:hypothetical protein